MIIEELIKIGRHVLAINLFRFSLVVLMNDYHFLPEGVEYHSFALKKEKKSFSFK